MPVNSSAGRLERRLAAIFCADVEGYTRLMRADEAGTLRLLASCREITDRLIGTHRGRIANTAGGSILAEFGSAVDALQCALEIQDRIAALNEQVPDDRWVRFRVGIHVGEVMVRDGDLLGDSVNVAARLQAIGTAGTVYLSEIAHQFTSRSIDIPFQDLGLQLVRNLDAPVRAYLARPATRAGAEAIPTVHRVEAHLARRFYEICRTALLAVTSADDLSPREYAVLRALDDAAGLDASQLAARLAISLAEAANLLGRLQQLGLAERTNTDPSGGTSVFTLAQRGQDLRRKLRPQILSAQDRVVASLSEQERATLRDLLVRVIQANEATARRDAGPNP